MRILNLRVTHKMAKVPLLEALTFNDTTYAMKDIRSLKGVNECVIVQTCHRVEIYAIVSDDKAETYIIEYWLRKANVNESEFKRVLEKAYDVEALSHLLRLASGLNSMIVGENQILGQVRKSYLEAKNVRAVDYILETVFKKAVNVGGLVRNKTSINKGAISVGSAAVNLAEKILGSLNNKKILIIGAGEIGTLVGKALTKRDLSAVFVANRTYERGVRLAKMVGGECVHFDKLDALLSEVDLVIVATAAPHYTLTRERVEKSLVKRNGKLMMIIDLSQPRNVEESVSLIQNVRLLNIDNLRVAAEENLKKRLSEVEKAELILSNELKHLRKMVKRALVEPSISNICSKIELMRQAELRKAMGWLQGINDKQREVIEDLTHVLIRRALHYPLLNLRRASENDDTELIYAAERLFSSEP